MRGCLKHSSTSSPPASSTSMATPPPTRTPTPPLIPPDVPSLAKKRRPPPSLADACLSRRCVHFCSELVDKVFVADEWDRSPAEITPRLTYQDMLELKEIQRSLPHASQPLNDPDLPELDARGVPRTHFLKTVPVGLVPLIGPATSPTSQPALAAAPPSVVCPFKIESPPYHSPPSRPPPSPPSTPPPRISVTNSVPSQARNPPKPPLPASCTVEPWVPPPPPPRLPYNIPIQPRPLPRFKFLPLLETPASTVVSTSTISNPTSQQCLLPPLPASRPVSPQDLSKTPSARPPSPRDGNNGSPPSSCVSQSGHSAQSASSSPSFGTTLDRPSNQPSSQLLPLSPLLSSLPSPDTKDASSEDSAHLEAELARLWHSHSCNTDGETEAEESEAESSVVHTEGDSDGECARVVVTSGGATKMVCAQVAVTMAADAHDDEEGEMSLVELESGVMAFVRVPRRR